MKIKAVKAFKVFDSNANPTIAVAIKHKRGVDYASAPAGTSRGKKEAESYRSDIDSDIKYFNLKIAPKLVGYRFREFGDLESVENKLLNVFASSRVALEFALLKALANHNKEEMYQVINPDCKLSVFPAPLGKAIGGGAHGSGDVQEYLFAPRVKTFSEAAMINAEIYHKIGKLITEKDSNFLRGRDLEGGWVSNLPATELLSICDEVKRYAQRKFNCEIQLGLDLAASNLWSKKKYYWKNYSAKNRHLVLSRERQISLVVDLSKQFFIEYLEDPVEESDFVGLGEIAEKTGKLVCADDFTCTKPELLREIIAHGSANIVVVKPNQVGSLLRAKEFVDLAKGFGLKTVVSHRSGDSADTVLSHLALAWEADYFKCGIAGGERVSKINDMVRLGVGA